MTTRKDPALSDKARYYAEQLRPHIPVILEGQNGHGREMSVLLNLSGLRRAYQVTLGIASIRAQYPEFPLVTLRWSDDRRVPLYAFDQRAAAVQEWRVTRLRLLYTVASRTWSGALYQMTLALPERERAIAQLQYRQFLETIEAVGGDTIAFAPAR